MAWSEQDAFVPGTTVPIPTRVLVLGMVHDDGSLSPAEIGPVAEACGQTREQVRSCLRRLVAEGLLHRDAGSPPRYRATEAGRVALGADRTRTAYGQDLAGRGWDRRWRLVAFAVPEDRRAARDALRDRLVALGGAAVQGGLYVSPHPWHDDVVREAKRLDIADLVTTALTEDLAVGGIRDPRELAARLWPIAELAREYTAFVDHFAAVPAALSAMRRRREKLPDAAFLPGALGMAVEFQRTFQRDPLLPPELLPRPWPGRAARQLLLKSRRLALAVRQSPGRPALFRLYDEALESLA